MGCFEQRATVGGNFGTGDAIESKCDTIRVGAGLHLEVKLEAAPVAIIREVDSGIDCVIPDTTVGRHTALPFARIVCRCSNSLLPVAGPALPNEQPRIRPRDSF